METACRHSQCFLDAGERLRATAECRFRPLTSKREDVLLHHSMDEPQAQGFRSRDALGREEKTQRLGPSDRAGQAGRPSPSREQAKTRARMGEDGSRRGVSQIAREREI